MTLRVSGCLYESPNWTSISRQGCALPEGTEGPGVSHRTLWHPGLTIPHFLRREGGSFPALTGPESGSQLIR